MVNSRGGIVRTLGLCLADCFCQLDFVEVASPGAPGIFRVGLGFSDVAGNFLGFSRGNAEHMWKYIRQFQFRRMHTDAYQALAKLCSAANS